MLLKAVQLLLQGQWTRWMNYVQQDFSWITMPGNLTSFCLASSYDSFPSPTNLKRLRITTETMCTICSIDEYTTTYILSVCKVSPQQRRYTIRHNTAWLKVTEALKTFILIIKKKYLFLLSHLWSLWRKEQKYLAKGLHQLGFFIMHKTGFF